MGNNLTNATTGIQILNFINNVKDWLGKKVVFSFFTKYQNIVAGINSWEKYNVCFVLSSKVHRPNYTVDLSK